LHDTEENLRSEFDEKIKNIKNIDVKYIVRINKDGTSELISSNIDEKILIKSEKQLNKSIYTLYFDTNYIKRMPIINIVPMYPGTVSTANVYPMILQINDKYCKYHLVNITSNIDQKFDCYFMIQSI